MPYENFKSKNPLVVLKITTNARKFGVETLQNEEFVSILLNVKKLEISSKQRQALAEIFAKLIKIEEDSQLSK